MSLKVIVPPHPLIKHWLSILREKETPNILYSTGYEQIGKWLTYEAIRNWIPYEKVLIKTSNGESEGLFINPSYPIRVLADIPEGLTLWQGSKEIIPNSKMSLGDLPKEIKDNEGIILYCKRIIKADNPIQILEGLMNLGVQSKRIIVISCICGDKGLNEIAKRFPDQVIFTACIDKEDDSFNLNPGIGNPMLRLSTMFHEKN